MKTTQMDITGFQILKTEEAMEINGGFSVCDTARFSADDARGLGHAFGDFFRGAYENIKTGIHQMLK